MPNISEWTSYQPVKGRLEFDNAAYNYIKMKITRHAIYLMCTPYYESGHLVNENVLKINGVADIPVPKKDHVPEVKFPAHHYQYESKAQAFSFTSPVKFIKQQLPVLVHLYAVGYTNIPEQPPKAS